MSTRNRSAHVLVTLAAGEGRPHVPAHLDVLAGAARPASNLDRGPIDRSIRWTGGAFRATAIFHARRGLGRAGHRARHYDDREQRLGLARTYRLQLAEADASRAVVDALRRQRLVESATPEYLATAPASMANAGATAVPDRATIERPHDVVRAPEALGVEPGDERVAVAVVDTGVALGHAEFQRKLLSGWDAVELGLGRVGPSTMLVGDSHGSDFSPADDVGHGSHVAGIIGAQGWQVPKGVGGRSLLLPIRVLAGAQTHDADVVTGVGAIGDIDAGLKVAVDLGAEVLNMSFGTPASAIDDEAPTPHERVVDYAVEHECVLVAASGNSGAEELFHPAANEHVIAVGSVDERDERSSFSTYGAHVALSAPGEDVVSVGRRGYRQSTGTSHAAPFVAGAAALLLARAHRLGLRLDAATVRRVLTATARPSPSPTNEVGTGVLDIAAALTALDHKRLDNEGASNGD